MTFLVSFLLVGAIFALTFIALAHAWPVRSDLDLACRAAVAIAVGLGALSLVRVFAFSVPPIDSGALLLTNVAVTAVALVLLMIDMQRPKRPSPIGLVVD